MKHYTDFGLTPLMAVVDVETLDTSPTAIILSIGCVVVNVFTGEEIASFYEVIDQDYQITQGRTSDQPTQDWWQKEENKTAWESIIHDGEMIELDDALKDFNEFLIKAFDGKRVQLMGNGPEFDNVKLEHAMKQLDIKPAWDYGANQSLRTVVWMGRMLLGIDPKYTLELADGEIKHHALHDARHEAKYLCAIFQSFIPAEPDYRAAVDFFESNQDKGLQSFVLVEKVLEKGIGSKLLKSISSFHADQSNTNKLLLERMGNARNTLIEYGSIQGSHHKQYGIDQALRTLCADDEQYHYLIENFETDESGNKVNKWDTGVA